MDRRGEPRGRVLKWVVTMTLGLLLASMPALVRAENRGIRVRVRAKMSGGTVKKIGLELYKDYYALVIGCGAYQTDWPQLPNAVRDARDVASILRAKGWRVDLLEDPTSEKLKDALNRLAAQVGQEWDRAVFVWYSGHGATLPEADGEAMGYLVPVDTPRPGKDLTGFLGKAMSMRDVEKVAMQIRSRHVLMVFDSCFSGAILRLIRGVQLSAYIQKKIAEPVREFITAGGENEKVPDRSVFKTCFLQGIEGYADFNKDGYVTGEELAVYLQENVAKYSSGAQHPQYGKINNPKLDKGDFVIVAGQPEESALEIRSTPSEAEVWVDGRYWGRTPLTVSPLRPGRHWVRVEKAGSRKDEREVRVAEGRTATVVFCLDRAAETGRLYVEREPEDARVRILNFVSEYRDGIELAPGWYLVEVSKAGYKTARRPVELLAGEEVRVTVRLRPLETVVVGPGKGSRPGQLWTEPVTGMKFVWVPEGCYEMGCGPWTSNCDDDEKPVHEVCVDGFWIGKYEVTQGQWKKIMGNNPSRFKRGDEYPVESVSWNDAQRFIKALNKRTGMKFRLPTEGEWEYAARSGGREERYAGGDDVDRVAWYIRNSKGHTHPRGDMASNGLEIYDMSGNVWEWCQDWYGADYYGRSPDRNPTGPGEGPGRVRRGGSWGDRPGHVRACARGREAPGYRDSLLGFRLALPAGQ